MKDNKQCNICAKQFICNNEKCKPVLWHNTKNFGEIERKKKNDNIR